MGRVGLIQRRGRGMSASPPIATEFMLGCELTRSADCVAKVTAEKL